MRSDFLVGIITFGFVQAWVRAVRRGPALGEPTPEAPGDGGFRDVFVFGVFGVFGGDKELEDDDDLEFLSWAGFKFAFTNVL